MKNLLVILVILLTFATSADSRAAALPDPRTLTFPPLAFQVPTAERVVLENGMVVYLLEDHELPLISIQAYIGAGSVYEPADKTGLAGLTGTVLRSGGTTAVPAEALDDELEFMASAIESGIGADAGSLSMSSLQKNFDRTLELYAQVMTAPAFREDRFVQARNRLIEAIRRENDDPKEVGDRELTKAVYQGHPLGRHPSFETVGRISRDDLVAFHRRFFHPDNVILAVSGDFDRKEIIARLTRVFGHWRKGDAALPPIPPPAPVAKPAVLLVKKDINQTVIRMGHLGIDKNNPDLHAIYVMNAILGGNGFNSRLMSVIREKEGLAYNAGSSFQAGRRFPGTFEAETETKAGSTARTIGLMRELITGMTRELVSDAELSLAKETIINSFIFGFTNAASVVGQKARLEYYGYPKGYLEDFRNRIARVTKEDVLRVARKYLHPDRMVLVVVGDEKRFDQPLSTFGEVREVEGK